MASPLFRIHDSELAVWKTGSNEIVGPKWRCRKTRKNEILLPIPQEVKDDLRIWAAAMNTVVKGLPIPCRPSPHLPLALSFASDASGAQFNKHQG